MKAICAPLILVLFIYASLAWGAADGSDLQIFLEVQKKEHFPGEPCLLDVSFSNTTSEIVGVNLGVRLEDAFECWIENQDGDLSGEKVVKYKPPFSRTALTPGSRIVYVNPGTVHVETLVLGRWVSTDLPSGEYMVCCKYIDGTNSTVLRKPIKISDSDDRAINEYYDEVFKNAKKNHQTRREMVLDADKLIYSKSKFAVPYLIGLVEDDNYPLRLYVLEGLARNKNPDAKRYLKRLAENPENKSISEKATELLNQLEQE